MRTETEEDDNNNLWSTVCRRQSSRGCCCLQESRRRSMSSSSSVVKTGTTCAAAAAAASAASLPFAAHACHFLPPPPFRDPSISSVAKTLLSQSLPQQHPPLRLPLTLLHHISRTGWAGIPALAYIPPGHRTGRNKRRSACSD